MVANTPSTIGKRLLFVRNQRKDAQSTTAKHILVSDRGYKNYESDKAYMPIPTALRFCAHYKFASNGLSLD